MVFDAHDRAFRLFQGACRRGIYEKTAVQTVLIGKERAFAGASCRCVATTWSTDSMHAGSGMGEGAGREPGRSIIRGRFFTPRLRFKTYDELNAWLLDQCVASPASPPGVQGQDCLAGVRPDEVRPFAIAGRSTASTRSRRADLLASTATSTAWRARTSAVRSRSMPTPIASSCQDGEIVAEHARRFGRDQTVYDPWH